MNPQPHRPKVNLTPRSGEQPSRSIGLAFAATLAVLAFTLGASPLVAQTAAPSSGATATITFADGSSLRVRTTKDKLPSVQLQPGENVAVELQLPQPFPGAAMSVQALDGGVVTQNGAIAANGTASLQFQAALQPGLYRILLNAGGRSVLLQFWVQQA